MCITPKATGAQWIPSLRILITFLFICSSNQEEAWHSICIGNFWCVCLTPMRQRNHIKCCYVPANCTGTFRYYSQLSSKKNIKTVVCRHCQARNGQGSCTKFDKARSSTIYTKTHSCKVINASSSKHYTYWWDCQWIWKIRHKGVNSILTTILLELNLWDMCFCMSCFSLKLMDVR